MKRILASASLVIAMASLMVAGCTPTPSEPTKAPAAPTKVAVEPTKALVEPTKALAEPAKPAAAQPTAAPAKKADFPAKGKNITFLVPYAAGGGTDIGGRILASMLEKELGTSIDVVNRPGGGAQVGTTELAKAKADGYTLGLTSVATIITIYLDPERQAVFGRKDLQPVSVVNLDPEVIAVKADSPFKSVKDLMDAAKANPGKIKLASPGLMGEAHLAILLLQKAADVKFAVVQFDGGTPAVTALMGGHVDAGVAAYANFVANVKAGDLRLLGVMDDRPSPFMPGVKTFQEQGYKLSMATARPIISPAGVPKEIVDVIDGGIKKVTELDEFKKKMDEMYIPVRYMNAAQFAAYWDELEGQLKPLIELSRQK